MDKPMKTITLKLYNAGAEKRNIIDEAMINYSRAFQHLLDAAYCDIENIKDKYVDTNGKYRALNVKNWISRELTGSLNMFNVEPFKDSLIMDFSAVLSGYLNTIAGGKQAAYPAAFITAEKFEDEYDRLMSDYVDDIENCEEIEGKIKKLLELKDRIRPIFFCRYSKSRNYSLLYDSERNKYFAKIYLMNAKNEKRKISGVQTDSTLYYISKDNRPYKKSRRRNCFLMLPLSFGAYQEEYLKKALVNPDILRTARLIKKNGEYFLSVSIIEDTTACIEASNYMGISRGIANAVNYTIVDLNGKGIGQGSVKAKESVLFDRELNRIANCLVKTAGENKSQIIMENLQNTRDGLSYRDKHGRIHAPVLNNTNYSRLFNILNSKIQGIGLPEIITVSSRDIFYTCPNCGSASKLNRFSENIIICIKCGMHSDIEKTGSLNLARKLIKYSNDKIKITVKETGDGLRFFNEDLDFEFCTSDPFNCIDKFNAEIEKMIEGFYKNINSESKNEKFRKKLSLIKKIEKNRKIFELIRTD